MRWEKPLGFWIACFAFALVKPILRFYAELFALFPSLQCNFCRSDTLLKTEEIMKEAQYDKKEKMLEDIRIVEQSRILQK